MKKILSLLILLSGSSLYAFDHVMKANFVKGDFTKISNFQHVAQACDKLFSSIKSLEESTVQNIIPIQKQVANIEKSVKALEDRIKMLESKTK